jgi:putative FmdB family regulatory protein
MPIFEYRCENCGQTNEFLILGKQEQLHCRHCGGEDLTKLMSAHNTSSASSERFTEKGSGRVLFPVITSVSLAIKSFFEYGESATKPLPRLRFHSSLKPITLQTREARRF